MLPSPYRAIRQKLIGWDDYPAIGAWLDRLAALPGWVPAYELLPDGPVG